MGATIDDTAEHHKNRSMELDEIDHQLLKIIQGNSRISNAELARQLNLSPSATHTRMSKLEEVGMIQQYVSVLNREALGFDLLCFIHISMHVHEIKSLYSFQSYVADLPEVLECHNITGQYDYILKVALRNRQALQDFVHDKLIPLRGISQISTSILLQEVKSSVILPLD